MYKRLVEVMVFTLIWEGSMIATFVIFFPKSVVVLPLCIIGLILPYCTLKEFRRVGSVKANGMHYTGVVVDYVDDQTMSPNGRYMVALQVRYYVACNCPKCGAELHIANHGTHKCEYCGQLISMDDDSATDDVYDVSIQGNTRKRRWN